MCNFRPGHDFRWILPRWGNRGLKHGDDLLKVSMAKPELGCRCDTRVTASGCRRVSYSRTQVLSMNSCWTPANVKNKVRPHQSNPDLALKRQRKQTDRRGHSAWGSSAMDSGHDTAPFSLHSGERGFTPVSFWRGIPVLRGTSLWDLFLHEVKNVRMEGTSSKWALTVRRNRRRHSLSVGKPRTWSHTGRDANCLGAE